MQQEIFFAVANLLNLEVDLLFFDASSTYWERDAPTPSCWMTSTIPTEPNEPANPAQGAARRYGRSKDHKKTYDPDNLFRANCYIPPHA